MEGISEFIFEGNKSDHAIPVISALKATRLIRQGCRGFLASVIDKQRSHEKIKDFPVVSEYIDVFLEDLPGLPTNKEVKFATDLLPGTSPILRHYNRWPQPNERTENSVAGFIR